MIIVNPPDADELSTIPTAYQYHQSHQPSPVHTSTTEEPYTSVQSSSSVMEEVIEQAVALHENEALAVPFAILEDDGGIEFDLGSSSNNTGMYSCTLIFSLLHNVSHRHRFVLLSHPPSDSPHQHLSHTPDNLPPLIPH